MACAEKQSATKQEIKKVLVVDDHPILCEGLTDLINKEEDLIVCGCAANISEALDAVRNKKPDVVTVDISLEGASGLDLIEEIKGRFPKLFVLALSMHDEALYVERALQAGARGYVTKREVTRQIVAALRTVLQGQMYLSDPMKEKLLNHFMQDGKVQTDPLLERLSEREMEIFIMLGQGKETREIAEQLNLSVKTVETYRSRIKKKLNLSTGSALLRCAFQWSSVQDDEQLP